MGNTCCSSSTAEKYGENVNVLELKVDNQSEACKESINKYFPGALKG